VRKEVPLLSCLLVFLVVVPACNPSPGSGTVVRDGVGIRDFYTMRSVDGKLGTRDVRPEPRPREAITGDDYFQIKLETIYIGEALGRDVGNLTIVSQIEGILPANVQCKELDVSDIGFDIHQRERSSHDSSVKCAYKHVLSINPVFRNGHLTVDSAFITPPFRMGKKNVGLRFIIGQLNDVELARTLLKWGQEQLNNLSEWGLAEIELNKWQSKLVDIGFTVANYILDYAAKPDYVFEFQTDFVPIEAVSGVADPQNLFMGGDFVIVGFTSAAEKKMGTPDPLTGEPTGRAGALMMSEKLVFDSGRLYWKDSKAEYIESPYLVFKVVRQSRYPAPLPVALTKIGREVERGKAPADVTKLARGIILDLQDGSMLNETEGRYLLDLFGWFAEAREVDVAMNNLLRGEQKAKEKWALQLQEAPVALAVELAALQDLANVQRLVKQLETRLYGNYARSPGITQAECVILRDVTQKMGDSFNMLKPKVQVAFEDLQIARSRLQQQAQRSPEDERRLQSMMDAELWADRIFKELEAGLDEPKCPGLRD